MPSLSRSVIQACEIVNVTNRNACQRLLDLAPVACPFASDAHAKYLLWRGAQHTLQPNTWCSRRFCTPSWLQKPVQKWFRPLQVDSSEGGAQDVKSSSPETEEQQNAKLFDAADYNSMNVIFEPMQEPLSKLERLLAELRQHANSTSRDSRQ